MAKLSHIKKQENYKNGIAFYKPKNRKIFKDIIIHKNNVSKTIKLNYYSAYKKIGWLKEV